MAVVILPGIVAATKAVKGSGPRAPIASDVADASKQRIRPAIVSAPVVVTLTGIIRASHCMFSATNTVGIRRPSAAIATRVAAGSRVIRLGAVATVVERLACTAAIGVLVGVFGARVTF